VAIVSRPDDAPSAVGSNCTLKVAPWLAVKVTATFPAASENPAPVTVAAVTEIGDAEEVDSVTVWVVGEFRITLPKFRLVALRFSPPEAPSCNPNDSVALPAPAVNVAVCDVLTAAMLAVKLALVAPPATVTDAGTVTAELLLARLTVMPPLPAGELSVTVQASVPAPVIELLAQPSPVNWEIPVPLRAITVVVPVDELLFSVSVPEDAPAAVGSNCTVSVADWPGDKVSGKLAPEALKPLPLNVAELTVT